MINELQLTLTNILGKRGIKVSAIAERAGYGSRFFEDIVTGKSCQVPVDFFVRVDVSLNLARKKKTH